jgi:hypothetical protein
VLDSPVLRKKGLFKVYKFIKIQNKFN